MLRSLRAVIREMHSTKERLLKFTYKCTPPPSQLTCYRQLSTHTQYSNMPSTVGNYPCIISITMHINVSAYNLSI